MYKYIYIHTHVRISIMNMCIHRYVHDDLCQYVPFLYSYYCPFSSLGLVFCFFCFLKTILFPLSPTVLFHLTQPAKQQLPLHHIHHIIYVSCMYICMYVCVYVCMYIFSQTPLPPHGSRMLVFHPMPLSLHVFAQCTIEEIPNILSLTQGCMHCSVA